MSTVLTQPTRLTKEEYKKCWFAINPVNGDHWLFLPDGKYLFVAQDMGSAKNSNPAENPEFWKQEVEVTDEVGRREWIDAWCCKTENCLNEIDLDELAEGKVEWI
jgi:hypothetical protein